MGHKSFSHKNFTLQMINWLMKKCKEYVLSTIKTEPPKKTGTITTKAHCRNRVIKTPNLKKRQPSSIEILTFNFPSRFHQPDELHTLSTVNPSLGRGTCVVCSANWPQLKAENPSLRFQREVSRTVEH
mmetsp:Transcript_59714/g.69801  ORF Transcript_59714/g.69801 Transcript_59714/m.69801 type:complete len:128 (-) Transcript_59714:91-474(-)